ncbi:hypothetical protein TKK_0012680 [Trichogramma kaykai]
MADLLHWVNMGGQMIGAIVGGLSIDFYGRKSISGASAVMSGLGILLSLLVHIWDASPYFYVFFQALVVQCIEIGSYVLCLEQMPPEKVVAASTLLLCSQALGFCLMSLVNFFTNNSQWDVFVVSAILGIGGILFSKHRESKKHANTIKKIVNLRGDYCPEKDARRYPGPIKNLRRLFSSEDPFIRQGHNNLL